MLNPTRFETHEYMLLMLVRWFTGKCGSFVKGLCVCHMDKGDFYEVGPKVNLPMELYTK
jgi:hypothetical protein